MSVHSEISRTKKPRRFVANQMFSSLYVMQQINRFCFLMLMEKRNILFLTCQFTTSLLISLYWSFEYESTMQGSRSFQQFAKKVPVLIMQTGRLKSALNFNRREDDLEINIRVFRDKEFLAESARSWLLWRLKIQGSLSVEGQPTRLPIDVLQGGGSPKSISLSRSMWLGEAYWDPLWTDRQTWLKTLPSCKLRMLAVKIKEMVVLVDSNFWFYFRFIIPLLPL